MICTAQSELHGDANLADIIAAHVYKHAMLCALLLTAQQEMNTHKLC